LQVEVYSGKPPNFDHSNLQPATCNLQPAT